jgi:hypothetical protein
MIEMTPVVVGLLVQVGLVLVPGLEGIVEELVVKKEEAAI